MVAAAEQYHGLEDGGDSWRLGQPLGSAAAAIADRVLPSPNSCLCDSSHTDHCSLLIERSANAWSQPTIYAVTQEIYTSGSFFAGSGYTPGSATKIWVGSQTITYDALGRPLAETQSGDVSPANGIGARTASTDQVFIYSASGQLIEVYNVTPPTNGGTAAQLTPYEHYVYGPQGQLVLRDRSTGDNSTMDQRLYALQGPNGSVQALANTAGQVVERFAYDAMGNAQALDANGNAYSTTLNYTGQDSAALLGQYFAGSVFGDGSGSPTADGSQFAWNILYHGSLDNAIAGIYNTPAGSFNPGQDSMLAPNDGMQLAGLSPYLQPQGFWGFYAQHEQAIETGVAAAAGVAVSAASLGILAPEAGAGVLAFIAAQTVSGAAGGFATSFLASGFGGGTPLQDLEAGTIGGVLGGGLSAAGIFAPFVGRAFAAGAGSLYGGLVDASTAAGEYAGLFARGFMNAPGGLYLGSGLGGAQEFFDRAAAGFRALSADPAVQEAAENSTINYGALDELGRPTGVNATITQDMIGTGTPANPEIFPPGWSGNGTVFNEARGHLLGAQLGGSGDVVENLVTLQQNPANSPIMRGFETSIRNAVENGEVINYSATPIYNGTNLVPRGITLSGSGSGGFSLDVTILNPAGQ